MFPSVLNVLVKHKEHCNLDSFPLRFGFSFATDQILTLKRESAADNSRQQNNRWKFKGTMTLPDTDRVEQATFVVLKDNEEFRLVTAWRNDGNTEFYLSEVMKSLRKAGELSVEDLLAFHPRYKEGKLCSHAELVLALSANKSSEQIAKIQSQSELAVQRAQEEIDLLRKENRELKKENMILKQQIESERLKAGANNTVNVTSPNTLLSVRTDVIHYGSSCTELRLADGMKWYMKTSTFDKNGDVTKQAQSLIGKPVVVTSWDPVTEPGKWSSRGYFRNVYPA
ncbi:cell division protein ZapB [Vibrio agarivorans]|uniref:cell division protein ZapB n=2 Tax=Vibrio agarivorans TaxID=153622 RepID=UPI0036F2C9D3